jgi:Zn-dependent peptidase ImmA (M78 family)
MDEADVQLRARAFVASVDVTNIADDLSAYLIAANARLLKEPLGKGESGTTFTRPDGRHLITINSLESEVRQRFTVCHEIAHIILNLSSSHHEVPSWSFAKRDPNEILCDTFATELLMPYTLWLKKVPEGAPSEEVINYMASEFKASFPAAASRYATLADIPCAFVTMERGHIRHAARSMPLRQAKAWIPPRSIIPVGSIAHRLRSDDESKLATGEVAQDIWFQDWENGLDMWEMGRHYQSSDTTISLLWFENDNLPEREEDRFGVRVDDDGSLAELTGELPWPGRSKRR